MDDEKQVERYLCRCVRRIGGRAYKWTSPGCCGVPDRLVFFPGGGIVPVELKAPGRKGNLSKSQQLQIKRLAAVGTKVISSSMDCRNEVHAAPLPAVLH